MFDLNSLYSIFIRCMVAGLKAKHLCCKVSLVNNIPSRGHGKKKLWG